ncbi:MULTISPECIES: ureidoglycolate lyase [unclassified Mycobacterium]|uniref:ureidoglycolate lyase n=1 Tax=Mycobacterium sp. DL99 TaxID=2528957 RepID=UPI001436C44C|nr:ureidoglycolate lyase [Mycobacterium sp. DL99]
MSSAGFAAYGSHFRLSEDSDDVGRGAGIGWSDVHTRSELTLGSAQLGMTSCAQGPWECKQMERHRTTTEVLVCTNAPIVLAVAPPTQGPAPMAAQVEAFTLERGDVVILEPGVWHDACRGRDSATSYLWIAGRVPESDAAWVDLLDGPVVIG